MPCPRQCVPTLQYCCTHVVTRELPHLGKIESPMLAPLPWIALAGLATGRQEGKRGDLRACSFRRAPPTAASIFLTFSVCAAAAYSERLSTPDLYEYGHLGRRAPSAHEPSPAVPYNWPLGSHKSRWTLVLRVCEVDGL